MRESLAFYVYTYISIYIYIPEMASERMRILICKFELSNAVISWRCLAAMGCPEMPQTAARAILGARQGAPHIAKTFL